jgi:acetyl esterase/lipase
MQLLLYPVLDAAAQTAAIGFEAEQARREVVGMWELYLGRSRFEAQPYASPAARASLEELPPAAIVVSEFDAFRDEAIVYAQRLLNDGVSVELHAWARTPHAFDMCLPQAQLSVRAVTQQCDAVRRFLRGPAG